MKKRLEYAFTSSVLVAIAWGLYAGRGWNATTALFPRAVGFPMLLVVAAILLMGMAKGRGRENDSTEHRDAADADFIFRRTSARMARYFGWLFLFVVAIWAIGITLAIPIYVLAYMKIEGDYGWWKCVVYASVTAGFITIVYGHLFQVAWPDGALFRSLAP
jgi:hypothetical protein